MSLAPPPRALHAPLQISLLFGSTLSILGWVFLAFGLIFVHVFARGLGPAELLRWQGPLQVVQGEVTGVEYLNASENNTAVQRLHFVYVADDSHRYQGSSYLTQDAEFPLGPVTVEVVAGEPEHARVQTTRTSPFGRFALFVCIFPGIGAALAAAGLLQGLRSRDLLINGRLAEGRRISTEPTNTRVNGSRVHRHTFAYETPTGEHRIAVSTHASGRIRDEATERVLYDPGRPERALLFDLLTGAPMVLPDGTLQVRSTARALAAGILPAATILIHGLVYLSLR